MTLVQNLLRPLNGSNLFLVFFLPFVWSSCALLAPTVDRGDTSPDSESDRSEEETIGAKVDTIEWEVVSEMDEPPITERIPASSSTFKTSYNVVLMAPFASENLQYESAQLSGRTNRLIQFYAGLKFALQDLTSQVPIDLAVVDSDRSGRTPSDLSQLRVVQEADLIIGPYFTDELKAMANYAKSSRKILISPWNSGKVVHENPYFVQARPSLEEHCAFLTDELKKRFETEEIMLIAKEDDPEVLEFCQRAHLTIEQDSNAPLLAQLLIADINDPALFDQLKALIEAGVKAFLVPNWNDEPFIISVLSKLNFAKADSALTLFGLPQWINMSKMDFDYYENLNVHVSLARPLRIAGSDAAALRRSYFEQYGTFPTDEAYFGMDIMKLVSHLLKENGTLISEGFANLPLDRLSHEFDFTGVFGEDGESIDYYQNQHLKLYKFTNYRFEPIEN
ncbi:MAG: hypothetical protein OEQ53_00085 [Saprospiraceae bacterium]|nr:hypothetical protein [Saprospiraceae bacterium]